MDSSVRPGIKASRALFIQETPVRSKVASWCAISTSSSWAQTGLFPTGWSTFHMILRRVGPSPVKAQPTPAAKQHVSQTTDPSPKPNPNFDGDRSLGQAADVRLSLTVSSTGTPSPICSRCGIALEPDSSDSAESLAPWNPNDTECQWACLGEQAGSIQPNSHNRFPGRQTRTIYRYPGTGARR